MQHELSAIDKWVEVYDDDDSYGVNLSLDTRRTVNTDNIEPNYSKDYDYE